MVGVFSNVLPIDAIFLCMIRGQWRSAPRWARNWDLSYIWREGRDLNLIYGLYILHIPLFYSYLRGSCLKIHWERSLTDLCLKADLQPALLHLNIFSGSLWNLLMCVFRLEFLAKDLSHWSHLVSSSVLPKSWSCLSVLPLRCLRIVGSKGIVESRVGALWAKLRVPESAPLAESELEDESVLDGFRSLPNPLLPEVYSFL